MSGNGEDEQGQHAHSPRTRGIIHDFERRMRLCTEGLEEDIHVTNEHLGQLEATQIGTNQRLAAMEVSIGEVNTSLAAILARLERMQDGGRNHAHQHHHNDGSVGSVSAKNDCLCRRHRA